uniref:Uncharacterized protein n=1 Tax=Rhodnius prolixus TaxID=13249 RepID=T1H888_RHOPR
MTVLKLGWPHLLPRFPLQLNITTWLRSNGAPAAGLTNREAFIYPKSLLRLAQVQCNLQLTGAVKKGITPEWELKAIALETIINRYPSPGIHGSALEARHNAGAGVYSEAFQISAPVGKVSTNYDGELAGILLALDKVKRDPWSHIVVFVDSRAAILAITGASYAESAV